MNFKRILLHFPTLLNVCSGSVIDLYRMEQSLFLIWAFPNKGSKRGSLCRDLDIDMLHVFPSFKIVIGHVVIVVLGSFFYPLLLWVFLVCFACYALLHIRGHSHSPPLICHYMSYLISTFTETTPGHMAPTRECTHFDRSCHKSM